ncbi:hypothetical protein KA050_04410, partial [Candidatus Gracilibacteria bacterium]|nr:hypothetical protein [Candidatus Gracilibacteria bacterium]
MSKKIALFLLVVVGLVGIVIWQTGGLSDSPEARFARAVKLMEGLQSRAIPVALSDSEIDLLEGVYQDSLVRLPNVKNFRDTDKKNLVSLLLANGFGPKTGETNGENGLNSLGEKIIMSALGRVDEFKSYLTTYFDRDVGNTPVKPEIKRLAQSINTLTNDIRLTTLFISWYENIRGTLCTTNDPENDIYISGELRFRYNNERLSLPDVCGGDNTQLKQHKCILGQYKDEESYIVRTSCPLGCRDGVCLKQNQSGLVVNFPEIVTVGKNTPIKVSVLDQNGQVDMNYTGVFFIIVGGDDEAVFPTGALNIMSGEAGRMNAVKFSKEGAMTVTVRTTTGWEVTKNVEVKKDEGNNRPYIQTDYPNKNEIFKSGDKIKIQWSTKNIALTEMVKIELGYQHHDKTYTAGTYFEELIVEKTPNNGSFVWEIPEYYSTGSVSDSFRIKVSALGIADYTDLNFSITQDTVGGNLTVTSPKQDSGYYNGDTLPIKWSKKENSSGLSLLKKSDPTFLKLFFPTGGSQGDSSWKIPTEIPQGSDYYIRVTEGASRKYTGYSGTFSIKPKTEPVICPQLSPPPADFCPNGEIVDGGKNANGCQLPP